MFDFIRYVKSFTIHDALYLLCNFQYRPSYDNTGSDITLSVESVYFDLIDVYIQGRVVKTNAFFFDDVQAPGIHDVFVPARGRHSSIQSRGKKWASPCPLPPFVHESMN